MHRRRGYPGGSYIYHVGKEPGVKTIKVMRRYTVKVDSGNGIENLWSGDDMSKAIRYETIAQQAWGSFAEVWICDNMQELTVG
tara:strand:- start:257 stop:505 length:249 start_codon:yes stop_codon:yes gene_type:complete